MLVFGIYAMMKLAASMNVFPHLWGLIMHVNEGIEWTEFHEMHSASFSGWAGGVKPKGRHGDWGSKKHYSGGWTVVSNNWGLMLC